LYSGAYSVCAVRLFVCFARARLAGLFDNLICGCSGCKQCWMFWNNNPWERPSWNKALLLWTDRLFSARVLGEPWVFIGLVLTQMYILYSFGIVLLGTGAEER
jgi:hypothetical protein